MYKKMKPEQQIFAEQVKLNKSESLDSFTCS